MPVLGPEAWKFELHSPGTQSPHTRKTDLELMEEGRPCGEELSTQSTLPDHHVDEAMLDFPDPAQLPSECFSSENHDKKQNSCYFQLLSFGALCYAAMDN